MVHNDDTIVAIITPVGTGGIAVLRISGKNSVAIADKLFHGKHQLAVASSHTVHFGRLVDISGRVIDEVVATIFREPHSYTGEDIVELSCHGSSFVAHTILRVIVECGARLAEPGEFTKRAFLNGKLDLSQAEAVADIIRSRSESSRMTSLNQLEGRLSVLINELRDKLLNLCGLMELELDFTEEGLEFVDKEKIRHELELAIRIVAQLIDSFELGRVYRDGIKVVIAGLPNVGKSSLMNLLLNEDRAIVTDVSGTTRDVLEEEIIINGILFRVVDTAGLRKTDNIVENEGIRRTKVQAQESDILLFVVDSTAGFQKEDHVELAELLILLKPTTKIAVILNKIDLLSLSELSSYPEIRYENVRISAKTGAGLDDLKKAIFNLALSGKSVSPDSGIVITNERHRVVLSQAKERLESVLDGISRNASNDLLAIDMRIALDYLGEIVGIVTTEDILNSIFSKFCIGK